MARRRERKPRTGRGSATTRAAVPTTTIPRIALVDFLRGAALIGMTVYHFVYDLEFFALKESGYSEQLHWWMLATVVAGSFVFLTGASLYLAHAHKIRWRPWSRRLAVIMLAALAITGVTRFVTPESYIFFGILHMIAFASVAGLAFLRAPWWLAAAAAARDLRDRRIRFERVAERVIRELARPCERHAHGERFPACVPMACAGAAWDRNGEIMSSARLAARVGDTEARRNVGKGRSLSRAPQPSLLPAPPASALRPVLDVASARRTLGRVPAPRQRAAHGRDNEDATIGRPRRRQPQLEGGSLAPSSRVPGRTVGGAAAVGGARRTSA